MKDVRRRVQEACAVEERQCNSIGTNGKELAEKNVEPEGGGKSRRVKVVYLDFELGKLRSFI
jgi:hypothetical protein